MALAIALHALAAVIWVGGMFFAYVALRPVAATLLQPPQRLPLWSRTFARFFVWVWAAVLLLPASGYWMVVAGFGGMGHVGLHVHIMQGLGWVMIALFVYLFFVPYRRMNAAIIAADWPSAGRHLGYIRRIIATNLSLGLLVVALATSGRYW